MIVTPSQKGIIAVRSACTLTEKLCVVERARSVGFARHDATFEGTPRSNVQRWMAQADKLENHVKKLIPSKKKMFCKVMGGRKPLLGDEVEEKLLGCCQEQHCKLLIVTHH